MDEIEFLKKEETPENVIRHSIAVYKKALKILVNFPEADKELIKTGALLHDIGRSKTHDIKHAVVGAEILRENNYSEDVVHIVERHIGVGISEKEAKELKLPIKSYVPESIEEKIVAHADNLLKGDVEVDLDFVIQKWKRQIDNADENIEKLIELDYELIGQFENKD
ncbi:TIGR00295 family protein [uncultured Methanobrevibacter sp.]|uniref:TIGR00295 family protein n=1 Tax=uncultured Methanobrevibacter sp. TaxID=253161 RepID=UPI0025D1F190|nr:TIGR00295 family protein [uncultured Methanobrevibacter sp.]